jgi:hypothetical protein
MVLSVIAGHGDRSRGALQVGIVQVGPIRSASTLLAANYGVTSPSSIRFFFDSPCETIKCDWRI